MTVNGFWLVTSADSNSVVSSSHRDPVGEFGSGIGRKLLGRTSEPIAAFTGDWSESRCGLKPGPIESMAMMICVACRWRRWRALGSVGALRCGRWADGAP